jgi:hypothetical protein
MAALIILVGFALVMAGVGFSAAALFSKKRRENGISVFAAGGPGPWLIGVGVVMLVGIGSRMVGG